MSDYNTDIKTVRDILDGYVSEASYAVISMDVLNDIIEQLNEAKCGDCQDFCINTKEMNEDNRK